MHPAWGNSHPPPQAVYYYLTTADQMGGVGHKPEFDGPYYEPFPRPAPAETPLRFALFVPQLADTWKTQVYSVEKAAERLNVQLSIYSAKGYVNLGRQIKQLRQFGPRYDGVIVSAIDSFKMDDVLTELGMKVPIVAYANEVYSKGIHAKAMVFYADLGANMGRFLIEHIKDRNLDRPMNIAFVMGPKGAEWSEDMKNGVLTTLYGDESMQGRFRVTAQKHGHTKKDMQEKLVRLVLDGDERIDLLVGTAPAIERAAAIREEYRDRHPDLQLAAIYLNEDLYPAIAQGKVLAAGSENLLDTGRLAVSILLKLVRGESIGIRGEGLPFRIGSAMNIYTPQNIAEFPMDTLFGPYDYEPGLANRSRSFHFLSKRSQVFLGQEVS